jgi:hypothetical protein
VPGCNTGRVGGAARAGGEHYPQGGVALGQGEGRAGMNGQGLTGAG